MELLQLVLKVQTRRSFVQYDRLPGAIKLYSNDLFRLLNYYSITSSNFSPCFIGFLFHLSDADATYSGHKGQGFQAQIMETFSEEKKETVLNLITHIEVEPSHNSDAPTLIPAIKSVKEQKMMPEEVLTGRLYGSDDNTPKADEMAVDIVSPVMGGADDSVFQGFKLSENDHIASCPQGHIPVKTRKRKDRLRFISDLLRFL
jgi:hypothetical protein